MRLTKIVATLGPASWSEEQIRSLTKAGMNVARINFSHGNTEQHRGTIQRIKQLNEKEGLGLAILLDTKGAEVRTGEVATPILITKGQEVLFSTTEQHDKNRATITLNYPHFAKDAKDTDRILLDNGELTFAIVSIDGEVVVARAKQDGKIGSRRHVNLPGAYITLPAMMDADWVDLAMGMEEGADYVALSFIRAVDEVEQVRKFLREGGSDMKIITKVEYRQALDNIDAMIAASDGIMVARGDLGAEIPFEKVPAAQDMMVEKCRKAGKPVIVATHMLESMINHPMPTRAEATDVAHAAKTRTDATMLSGETATGINPVVALEAMAKILEETEKILTPPTLPLVGAPDDEYIARAEAAVAMAHSLNATAIVAITRSGRTAKALARCRSTIPVLTFTPEAAVQRELQLYYGILPTLVKLDADLDISAMQVMDLVTEKWGFAPGTRIVFVAGSKGPHGKIGNVQILSLIHI